jgi:recombination protein RecA
LSELRGDSALTMAFALVREAQEADEPAAYVSGPDASFYPPDVAEGGVDLDALVVVRAAEITQRARAADELIRSGAFALVVLDLVELYLGGGRAEGRIPPALLSRLHGLAQKHHSAIVFLTSGDASDDAPSSLGPLISMRAVATRRLVGESRTRYELDVQVMKDKRRAPGWTHTEHCRAPLGLA